MSLFDINDPQSLGILSLGLRLMSAPGGVGQALGQSGLGALGDIQGAQRAQQQKELIGLQIQKAKADQEQAAEVARRQKMIQAAEDQFRQSLVSPQMQGAQAALSGGGGPTAANATRLPAPDNNANLMFGAMQAGMMSPLDYVKMQQKDTTPIKLGAGEKLLKPGTFQEIASNPKEAAGTALAKLLAEMNSLPENDPRRRVYMDAISKATTHQPGVSVSYGQPVAGVDASGNPVFFQPAKGGGAPAIVPGVKPAPQNRDTKLPSELQRMQIAGDAMGALLTDYEVMLKKHNPRDPATQMNPTVRAEMQSLKRNLELQFKELQALGALAGPDITIMRQALSDPFTMTGAYYGREGLMAQVKQARSLLQKRSDAVQRSQGRPGETQPPTADPLGIR